MRRHFYICNNLDELEIVEKELENHGISTPHIHVLSLDDGEVARHSRLHEVEAVLRTDVVHGTEVGALIGVLASATILLVAHFSGWAEGPTWIPFIFLSIILLGFCTWEGGFFGIQIKNKRFARFESALKAGKHLFFVDIETEKEQLLSDVIHRHPLLEDAGEGPSVPHWFIRWQDRFKHFIKVMP
jgi:hypothetical protein